MKILILAIFSSLLATVNSQPGVKEYLDFAVQYTEEGKHAEAIKVCDKLLDIIPENAEIYYLRGVNYYLLKDFEAAITDFDKTLELNTDHPDALLYRAKSKKELNDYLGALGDYNKAKNESFSKTLSSLAGEMIKSIFTTD